MKKITMPNGLTVSEICLGAMNFGTTTDEKSSFEVADEFVSCGGNFIDTSNNYAHWAGTGDESELTLGKWLKARKNRSELVIATKVGFDRHGEGAGLKREQIVYWVEQSLKKLGTDYIDLYYAHVDDTKTPLEETLEAFDRLVRDGKVRALGGSNYDVWRFDAARRLAAEKGLTAYSVMQQRFSYLGVRGDIAPKYPYNEFTSRERLRYLAANGLPLVAYSCLCKGGYFNDARLPADHIKGNRWEVLDEMARAKGVSRTALVVAYLTNLGRVEGYPTVIPLFASSSAHHMADNISGADIVLTDDELNALVKA